MNEFFLIKDLARLSGQSIHTIKYYLKIGLLKEAGRCPTTRFRYFNNSTLQQLMQIRQLRKQNQSIKKILERFNP